MTTETSTPNKAHLLQWARALESGDFAQGDGILRNQRDEYCCLGVACEIAREDVGATWEVAEDAPHYVFILPDGGQEVAYLPRAVAAWLGFDSDQFDLNINPELDGSSATCRNDSLSNSFAEIAAAVRREFDLLTKEQDEHVLAWIEALESDEYGQGTGHLKDDADQYCCLGVACDLAAKDGVGSWGTGEYQEYTFVTPDDDPRTGVLPNAVQKWLGVNDCDPTLDGREATMRNDHGKQTFAEIAAAARIEFGYPPKKA